MIEALQHRLKETQWERDLISNGPPRSFERELKSQSQWYIFLQPTPGRCQVISEPIIPAFIQADNGFKTKFYTFFFGVISPDMRHCHRDFYRTQVSLGSGLWIPVSLTPSLQDLFENFTDVTLADDDTNSIIADDANRAICGWWMSSNRWWLSPMWAWRSPRPGEQELHGILELVCWWAVIMLATIHVVGTLGGNGCHWDGGGRVGWQGGAQGGKGGYQGVEKG